MGQGRQVAILLGRIIVVVALGIYWSVLYFSPIYLLPVVIAYLLLIPFVVDRARLFRLRNTSLRNFRFGFRPDYRGAINAWYGGMLLTVVTLGFGYPYAAWQRQRFAVQNSAHGRSWFVFDGAAGPLYSIYTVQDKALAWRQVDAAPHGFRSTR